MDDAVTSIETKVVYFPPDAAQRTRKAKDFADAQRICDELAEHHPLIQQRRITVTPWAVVANATLSLEADRG